MRWVSFIFGSWVGLVTDGGIGKVGMSVLVKGLAMDFVRQGREEMAITSIWPASVCWMYLHTFGQTLTICSLLNPPLRSSTSPRISPTRRI